MERVAVAGSGGAGKSTFSRELARVTGLPLVHLDRVFWKPGWVEPTTDEWRATQAELVAEPRWILDGNYGGTMDLRLPAADTLIIFGLPRLRCLAGALSRSIKNRGVAVQAEGCPERMTADFFNYIWKYPTEARVRLNQHIANYGNHLRVIEFTSHRDAAAFLDHEARHRRGRPH